MHTISDVLVFILGQSGRVHSYVTSGTEINVNCFHSVTSNVFKPRSANIFKTLALRQSTISITSKFSKINKCQVLPKFLNSMPTFQCIMTSYFNLFNGRTKQDHKVKILAKIWNRNLNSAAYICALHQDICALHQANWGEMQSNRNLYYSLALKSNYFPMCRMTRGNRMLLHVSACIPAEVEEVIFLLPNISLRQKAPHFCDTFTKDKQNIKILLKVSKRITIFPNYIN